MESILVAVYGLARRKVEAAGRSQMNDREERLRLAQMNIDAKVRYISDLESLLTTHQERIDSLLNELDAHSCNTKKLLDLHEFCHDRNIGRIGDSVVGSIIRHIDKLEDKNKALLNVTKALLKTQHERGGSLQEDGQFAYKVKEHVFSLAKQAMQKVDDFREKSPSERLDADALLAHNLELKAACQLAIDMIVANNLNMPNTVETLQDAISGLPTNIVTHDSKIAAQAIIDFGNYLAANAAIPPGKGAAVEYFKGAIRASLKLAEMYAAQIKHDNKLRL